MTRGIRTQVEADVARRGRRDGVP
ncbi:MAG: hypothetical protein RLZZ299_854, partial [Pseudomonadota bacterium]